MNGKNRRRHTRVRARNIAAHLRIDEKASACQVEDISQGGLFLRTEHRLPVGLAVIIDLARPGLKRPLRVSGVVAQSSDAKQGLGIRFDPLDEDAQHRLADILRDLGAYTLDATATLAPRAPAPVPVPAAPSATTTGQMNNPFARQPQHATAGMAQSMPPAPLGAPAASGAAAAPKSGGDEGRLMIQIKGLLLELGSREQMLSTKDRELRDATDEVEKLRHEVRRKDDQLYALEQARLAAERALAAALTGAAGGPGTSTADLRAEADIVLQHAQRVVELARRLK